MLLLNKILPLLVLPLGAGILCMLAGLLLRKRLLLWSGVIILYIFSMPVVSNALMGLVEGSARKASVSSVSEADVIVVLSGMIHQVDGAPLGEWGDAVDRFEGGIDLFKAGKAPVIMFTRGQVPWLPNAIPEGDLLSRRAALLGVPHSAIRLTSIVGNTADEALAARKMLGVEKRVKKSIILVTSAFHMRRAQLLFEQAGFEVIPYKVDYQVDPSSELTVLGYLPNAEAIEKSERALREVIGWIFYWVHGLL
jgi:uncharacterized SAM-binding protein YcdF (DUF218 family)